MKRLAGQISSAAPALLAAGILLFAVGAKLALVHRYGGDQPFADQWAGEGATLFRARLYGRLGLENFFMPHGEHHPALTRFLAYGLFLLDDRQWDNRVELVANLLIYAAYLWLVASLIARAVGGRWRVAAALAAAVLFALPANRENFLWGFQSQFLFLLLCGLAHVAGTLQAPRIGWRWTGAQLAGLAGLFSIAAGVMSAVLLAGWAAWHILRGRRTSCLWATLAVNVALAAIGFWLLPDYVRTSASRAPSVGGWITASGFLLGWPMTGPWWTLLAYLPLAIVAVRMLPHGPRDPASGLLVAAGAWVVLVVLAIAFGRGAHPDAIAVRYYDIVVLGVFLNALALARLLAPARGGRRLLAAGLAAVWLLAVGSSLYRMNRPAEVGPELAAHRAQDEKQAAAIAILMRTRDPAALAADPSVRSRFPHFQLAVDLLLDPGMRPCLAPSLTADGRAGPLSRLAPRIAAGWWALMAAGVACLAAGAAGLRPPASAPAGPAGAYSD